MKKNKPKTKNQNYQPLATKKPPFSGSGDPTKVGSSLAYHPERSIAQDKSDVKSNVEVTGFAPAEPWMISQVPHSSTPTLISSIAKV